MLKVYRINVFFPIDNSPSPRQQSMFCTLGLTLIIMDGHGVYRILQNKGQIIICLEGDTSGKENWKEIKLFKHR